jgi:hypothetical protein
LARWSFCVAGLAAVTGTSLNSQNQPINPPKPLLSVINPEVNRPPDANKQMEMREQLARKQNFAAANAERKKQLDEDSARLMKIAADLKTELDKGSRDTLSPDLISKVDEIERLAHIVKEKMKLTVGGN